MTDLAIEVKDLRKTYGEVEAVRGVSFEVASGEVFGFLGPNGAGKTTTINALCTLAKPSSEAEADPHARDGPARPERPPGRNGWGRPHP